MQEHDGLNAERRELELALRSVAPAAVRLDPVSAAFAAGKASGRRQARFWRALVAIVLAGGIAMRLLPAGRVNVETSPDRPDSVLVLQQQSPEVSMPDASVLMLQRAINDRGADGLPAPRLCPVQTLYAGDIL
jgi:hypothetical protein